MIDLMGLNVFSSTKAYTSVCYLIGVACFPQTESEPFSSTSTHLTDVQYIFLSLDPSNHRPGQLTK
jgi:hypothetical protein